MSKRKNKNREVVVPVVDATLVMGDITQISQITRTGNTVTMHGQNQRSYAMESDMDAVQLWQALTHEASSAVMEDRQFFCVSVGGAGPGLEDMDTDSTVH